MVILVAVQVKLRLCANCALVQVGLRSTMTMLMLTVVRFISQLSMSGSNIATSFGSEITVCKAKFTKVMMLLYIIIQTVTIIGCFITASIRAVSIPVTSLVTIQHVRS